MAPKETNGTKYADKTDFKLLAKDVSYLVTEFSAFKDQTEKDFKEIKDNTSITYAGKDIVADHERRITSLEDDKKWLIRSVGAIIIAAVMGAALWWVGQGKI